MDKIKFILQSQNLKAKATDIFSELQFLLRGVLPFVICDLEVFDVPLEY